MMGPDYALILCPDKLIENINENVAAIFYGSRLNRPPLRNSKYPTAAKKSGALVILDLAHSAGLLIH